MHVGLYPTLVFFKSHTKNLNHPIAELTAIFYICATKLLTELGTGSSLIFSPTY